MTQERIQVLDHGYLMHVESWGSDERIIEAARMSTSKGFQGWGPLCDACRCNVGYRADQKTCNQCGEPLRPGDERLLRYLWEHKHATPFEMAGLIIEVQAPIFVFREWHRHRTQSYNELSARYTSLPDLNYVPSAERLMLGNDGKNKQAGTASGAALLTIEDAREFRGFLMGAYADAQLLYDWALQQGVPKELARVHLPVGRYSRMRASANLRNWLAFLTLRMAPQAQWEIRQYANAVGRLIENAFPRTWDLFSESKT